MGWMKANMLKLKRSKTEVLLVGECHTPPEGPSAAGLGTTPDTQVVAVAQSAYYHLRLLPTMTLHGQEGTSRLSRFCLQPEAIIETWGCL